MFLLQMIYKRLFLYDKFLNIMVWIKNIHKYITSKRYIIISKEKTGIFSVFYI